MNAKEKVYNFITDQITDGKLNRDDHITEQYLANNLKISRTPIREALLMLSNENILEKIPRKGYKIKAYTEREVKEIYGLIGLLDGKAAELAIKYLNDEDIKLMGFYIDSMDSAIDHSLYTEYNTLQKKFHDVYLNKCPNKEIVNELNRIKEVFVGKNYDRMNQKNIQSILKSTNNEHKEILNLIKANEAQKLRDYIENKHWRADSAEYDIW